jgi:hypothetical protein
MTEEEAKTKWCPAFRGNDHGVNRPNELKTNAGIGFCVGSACMAWRWAEADSLDKPTRVHPGVLKDHWQGWTVTDSTPDANGYVEISPPAPKLPHGHCGLAGKP